MKKWYFIPILVLLFFSCKSAPAPGPSDAEAAKDKALAAMESAKSIKADVAVKAEFDAAMALYTEGEAIRTGAPAADKYSQAEQGFVRAYTTAKEQRDAAQSQLDKAKQEIKTVEDEAAELETLRAEGGEM